MNIDTPPRGIEDVADPETYWEPDPQHRHRAPRAPRAPRQGLAIVLSCAAILIMGGALGVAAWLGQGRTVQTGHVETTLVPVTPAPTTTPAVTLGPTNTTVRDGSNLEAGTEFRPGTYMANGPTEACRWRVIGPDGDVEQQGSGKATKRTKRTITSGRWFTTSGCGDWTRVPA